ncbi:MAG: DNA polymerase/3'-5' exonuclease PolX, partial [Alphaproteobacteria bacterium]|nr:DNA polymerase/3'-5' exonuclease PolX [Alphaproteobacteria bacterium]
MARLSLPLNAAAVAPLLIELGRRIALAGGDYFRSRAYLRAAERIAALGEPLARVVAEGRLRQLPGIGEAIARIVSELHLTGRHPLLDRLRREVPDGLVEMLAIPGLRPDKVNLIHRALGVANLSELEQAAQTGRLKTTKGLGAALQRKVLEGLRIRQGAVGARHVHRAAELVEAAIAALERAEPKPLRVVPAGDLRRGGELVRDLAVVAEMSHLRGPPRTTTSGDLAIHVTDPRRFGITLLRATGSDAHLAQLEERAAAHGMSLTPQGLRRGRKIGAAKSEPQIYAALGLQYVEPELREGLDEVALAAAGRLPRLVSLDDLHGVLHAHTSASDGADTLEAMVEASRRRGYAYIGITDHSKTAHYAGGLSVAEIAAQHAEIDRLNAALDGGFRIFKGIESDILPDGSLDYPNDVLAGLDFVVASIHGQFRMNKEAQTHRLVKAAT